LGDHTSAKDVEGGKTWNKKPLSLHVDHKDGNTFNNKSKNLRFLCPNCHSQTANYSGRKNRIDKRKTRFERPEIRRVKRPTSSVLKKLLWEMPTTQIAKRFGVSDKAVEKWAKFYKIPKPPRGYWAKKKADMVKLADTCV
jgi:hypothetical protein